MSTPQTEAPPRPQASADTAESKTGTAPRPMQAEDLMRFVWAADPQISPDGARVAFTRVHIDPEGDEYRTALWVISSDGGAPRPLTFGPYDSQPRWSPDGRTLAFVRKKDAEAPPQLWVLPMEGGEARERTTLAKGAASPAWSPDGKRLVFVSVTNPKLDGDPAEKKEPPKNAPARIVTRPEWRMNGEEFRDHDHLDHVWVVDAEDGAPRQLTHGRQFSEAGPRWSRDGKWIFFVSDRREQPWFGQEDSDLWAVSPDRDAPTDGKGLEKVVDLQGPILGWVEAADGAIATVSSLRTEEFHSFEVNDLLLFEGAWPRTRPRVMTDAWEFDVWGDIAGDQHPPRAGGAQPLAWGANDASLFVTVGRHGASLLARIDRATGRLEELTDAAREVISGTASRDGTRLALAIGNPQSPGDLFLYDARSGELRRLWGPNDEFLQGVALSSVEEIWVESFDGKQIHAWVVKPPDFDAKKKYPLILEIHGGPHVAYGVGFFHEFQALAAAGYVVLYTNPRGSTTYGWEFANIIQYKYPGDDYLDLMACVDAVVKLGYVDESRMGVTGGSGGGLLTNWVVTQTDRFKAAITQRCVSDWESMWYSSDFSMFTPFWFKKPPFEDPQEYRDRSPVHFIDQVKTPLMVIHSEEDWRTPIAQGETMFRALLRQRKPTVMVRFPGESHELSRSGAPSRRVQNQQHIRGWFDKWLMGIAKPEYDPPAAETA